MLAKGSHRTRRRNEDDFLTLLTRQDIATDDERKQAILERNGLRVVRIAEAALRRQVAR